MKEINLNKKDLLNPKEILENIVHLEYGAKVADLGCGTRGYFTLAAAKMIGGSGLVYAVDIQKEALSSIESKAKLENLLNIKTIWSDLEVAGATNLSDSVDVCLLVTVLFQNKNYLQIIKESVRLLKPQGKLLIIEWLPKKTTIGPDVDKRISADSIKKYVVDLKLKQIKEFPAGKYHYGILFKKDK